MSERTSGIVYAVKKNFYKYNKINPQVSFLNEEEESLYSFIDKNLTANNQGILTNLLGNEAIGDLPGGRETLSESIGLLMQYALEADSPSLFEKQYLFLKEVYSIKDGIILWKVNEKNERIAASNALIDDLRIGAALLSAYEKWGKEDYRKYALEISKALLKYNIRNDLPVDFYDYKARQSSSQMSVRYASLSDIGKLASADENWRSVLGNTEAIVRNAYTDNDKIFFYEIYDTDSGKYVALDKVNMVNQLITIENLMKAGTVPVEAINWLKSNFSWYGFIAAEYRVSDKSKASDYESPAIYALCSRIFHKAGDFETSKKFHERMLKYQRVSDKSSVLYGGYAHVQTGEAYSFDNLQALLAVRLLGNRPILSSCTPNKIFFLQLHPSKMFF